MKKNLALVTVMALLVSMLAGCGGSSKSSEPAPATKEETAAVSGTDEVAEGEGTTWGIEPMAEPVTINLGFFSGSPHSSEFYIMEQKGWLEELGITFNYNSFISGPAMMEANADWDICTSGGPGVINGILNYDVTAIGIVENEVILNLYVREDSPIAKSGKGHFPDYPEMYGTADDWKGTEWLLPLGTTMHMTMISVLEQMGLTANDVTLTNMDATTALTAFRAGEGDGMGIWTSTALTAEKEGKYVKVVGAGDNGIVIAAAMCATDKALADPVKREAIQKIYELYYHTAEWIQENMEDAATLYAETCAIEGITTTEDFDLAFETYSRTPDHTMKQNLDLMLQSAADESGLAGREITGGEQAIMYTFDFFVSQDKYTNDQRAFILDNHKISSEIAEEVQAVMEAR